MDANKIATHRDMYNAGYDEVAADDKCFCYDEVYSMLSGRETVRNGSSYGYRQLVKCGDVARQDNFRPVVISYYENQEPLTTSFETNHYSNTQLKFDAGDLTFNGEKHSTHKIRVQFDTTVDLLSGETYEQPITLGSSADSNIYSVGRYSSSSTVDDTVIIDLDQIEGSALDPNNKFVTFIVDGLKSITAQLRFNVKLPDTTGPDPEPDPEANIVYYTLRGNYRITNMPSGVSRCFIKLGSFSFDAAQVGVTSSPVNFSTGISYNADTHSPITNMVELDVRKTGNEALNVYVWVDDAVKTDENGTPLLASDGSQIKYTGNDMFGNTFVTGRQGFSFGFSGKNLSLSMAESDYTITDTTTNGTLHLYGSDTNPYTIKHSVNY